MSVFKFGNRFFETLQKNQVNRLRIPYFDIYFKTQNNKNPMTDFKSDEEDEVLVIFFLLPPPSFFLLSIVDLQTPKN